VGKLPKAGTSIAESIPFASNMKILCVLSLSLHLFSITARADEFYVSCKGDNSIAKLSGDSVTTLATGKGIYWGLAVDRSGNIYASNEGSNDIVKFASVNGTLSSTPKVFASGLNGPTDLAFDPSGNLFEIESSSGNINKFVWRGDSLSNKPVLFVDGSPKQANLTGCRAPSNLAFDPKGNLYLAIMIGGILKFSNTSSGLSNMPDKEPFCTVSRIRQMAFSRNGDMFAANHLGGEVCVYRFPASASGLSGKPEVFAKGDDLNAPIGVTFDPVGNLYVTNWGYGSGKDILEYPNNNGVLSNTPEVVATDLAAPILIVWR
jgi:sugar lactone lactonase YvrE